MADTQVSETFYRVVVQGVLLFGSELWVLSEEMVSKVEGTQTWLLLQIKGKRVCKNPYRMW